jgi:hypothetical protein
MAYDPSPVEWLGIFAFIPLGIASWGVFAACAQGYGWRIWWRHDSGMAKGLVHPFFFSFLYFLVCGLSSTVGFLNWQDGFGETYVISGTAPTDTVFLWSMIVYLIYLVFSFMVGPGVFSLAMDGKNPYAAVILLAFMTLVSIGLTIVSFFVWFVYGILAILVALFWLYATIISWIMAAKYSKKRGTTISSHTHWNAEFIKFIKIQGASYSDPEPRRNSRRGGRYSDEEDS